MKITTIARNPLNSPQMTESDAAILRAVEKELVAKGANIKRSEEDEDITADCQAIIHMSRTATTLQRLKEHEAEGTVILNTPGSVENCSRIKMVQTLERNGIKQPQYKIINSNDEITGITYPAWIKRGEGWSCHKEDVAYVKDAAEAIKAFAAIKGEAVICDHIAGDIVKFYGIGERFFSYSYPDVEKTKFGLERINGTPQKYPFKVEDLKETAFKAAEALGLSIFGGDAIITPEGEIYIIDLNDFPSFSPVREEAAREIATIVIENIKENERTR